MRSRSSTFSPTTTIPPNHIGMLEASNRFGITSVTTTSAPDLFEAGLNEAACCWPGPMGVRGERGGPTIYSARVASEA